VGMIWNIATGQIIHLRLKVTESEESLTGMIIMV
jgi:hypothetical protein